MVGYVIERSNGFLVLASGFADDGDYSDRTEIPMCLIKKIQHIKEP